MKYRKFLAIILSICIGFSVLVSGGAISPQSAYAGESEYIIFTVEKFTIGQGYLVEPVIVQIESGETCDVVFDRAVTAAGYDYEYSGDIGSGFYLSSIKNADSGVIDIPDCISSIGGAPSNDSNTGNSGSDLGEFSYSYESGWCYSVNNEFPVYGMSDYELQSGDVFRVQFTIYGYGADIGNAFMENVDYEIADKDALTAAVARANANYAAYSSKDGFLSAYANAMEALITLDGAQQDMDAALKELESIMQDVDSSEESSEDTTPTEESSTSGSTEDSSAGETESGSGETEETDLYTVLCNAADYIISCESDSGIDSQWNIIGLARFSSASADGLFDTFYNNCAKYFVQNEGVLTTTKYTEYSKLILSMTAIGKDASNVSGYNLLYYLSDFDNVKKQGINGPIWALIALNSNSSYEIPLNADADTVTTEEILIDYILGKQNEDGGYALSGTNSDVDLTAMAVTALAPYYNIDAQITEAINRALEFLSAAQDEVTAGFSSYGSENSESSAQVLVALCSLAIDAAQDERFVKNGINLIDVLCSYQKSSGGFSHMLSLSVNGMATEQAFYALTAYYRFLNGSTALFDMNDVMLTVGEDVTEDEEETTGESSETSLSGESSSESTSSGAALSGTASSETSSSVITQGDTLSPDTSSGGISSGGAVASAAGSKHAGSGEKSGGENDNTDDTEQSASEYAGGDDGWSFDGDYYEAASQNADGESGGSENGLSPAKAAIIALIVFLIIIFLLLYSKVFRKKKTSLMMFILVILLFTGCSKDNVTVGDMNELPEDGIVSVEIISAFAGTDRTVSFYSTDKDTGIEYVWQLDGSKIKNPSEQNLKLTFNTEGLDKIKEAANGATYALEVDTYGSGLVCSPVLTITVPEYLDIDTAYLCKLDGDSLSIMSDIEITASEGAVSMSMNMVETGDSYYIIGGLSETGSVTVQDGGSASDNNEPDSRASEGSADTGSSGSDGASNGNTGASESSGGGSDAGGADDGTGSGNNTDNAGATTGGNSSVSVSTSDSESKSASETSSADTCIISINCGTILDNMDMLNEAKKDFVPSDGWILRPTTVTVEDDDSVHDILKRVCRAKGIHMESSFTIAYNSAYVEGINQLYEFDCGELSGWMYSVNGWFPNYGCSQYEVEDGDVIKFVYTCDLGRDVGDNSLAN